MTTVSQQDVDKVVNFLYNTHTRATYRSALAEFIGIELTTINLQKAVANWGDLSRSTITVRMAALKRLVKYKSSVGECDDGILDKITVPVGKPPSKRRALSEDELRMFVGAARTNEEHLMVALLFDAGLRAGFIPKIRYKDLLGESFELSMKGDKTVEVFVTKKMRFFARRMVAFDLVSEDDYIFTFGGKEPVPYKYILRMFRRLAKAAGIENITPHSGRHTFANRLSEADVPLPVISELMGHSSVQTTMIYIHPGKAAKKEAIQKITT